ncbi:hypothetical protein NBO_29g0036 [Nosema bombycis CQ1]|uniref:Uncharacterized protein n=1 Tax=Nosema bombycis (strain CQ1 / CVCC 102059) TaxID=578461 RepID=R0M8S5_NOSB1|nr:hypothetical protein NBO_29g0036 [Nosema bombycis CQ1]|eukprot:EOB14354.1 hypothetical protein NBO_29g0036 [Nosema bombycis CQ1]
MLTAINATDVSMAIFVIVHYLISVFQQSKTKDYSIFIPFTLCFCTSWLAK